MKLKKGMKICVGVIGALVLGAVLLGVLNALVGGGSWNLGWTDYTYDDSQYKVGDGSIPSTKVTTIDLDWIDGSVTVVTCQDTYVSVTETASEELTEGSRVHWCVSEDGTMLSIKYRESSKFFGVSKNKNKDLILRIPEKLMPQLQALSVKGISADISITDVTCEALTIKSSSGEVQTKGVTVQHLAAENVSGKLKLGVSEMPVELAIESLSGDVELSLPSDADFSLQFQTKSGGTPAIDFAVEQNGEGSYVCQTGKVPITVNTKSGKLSVKRIAQNA